MKSPTSATQPGNGRSSPSTSSFGSPSSPSSSVAGAVDDVSADGMVAPLEPAPVLDSPPAVVVSATPSVAEPDSSPTSATGSAQASPNTTNAGAACRIDRGALVIGAFMHLDTRRFTGDDRRVLAWWTIALVAAAPEERVIVHGDGTCITAAGVEARTRAWAPQTQWPQDVVVTVDHRGT